MVAAGDEGSRASSADQGANIVSPAAKDVIAAASSATTAPRLLASSGPARASPGRRRRPADGEPVWEEVAWTGFLHATLQRQGHTPMHAALLVAPLFIPGHSSLVAGIPRQMATFLLVLGVLCVPLRALQGWLYHRTGSLLVVGALHAAGNKQRWAASPVPDSSRGSTTRPDSRCWRSPGSDWS